MLRGNVPLLKRNKVWTGSRKAGEVVEHQKRVVARVPFATRFTCFLLSLLDAGY